MRILWIVWVAIATHLWWGSLLLLYADDVTGITAIKHTMDLGFSPVGLGCVYIGVSVTASCGLLGVFDRYVPKDYHWFVTLIEVLPQQSLLVYSAIGAIQAIVASQFADGVIRPRAFIAADQFPAVALCVFHTCAILEIPVRRLLGLEK